MTRSVGFSQVLAGRFWTFQATNLNDNYPSSLFLVSPMVMQLPFTSQDLAAMVHFMQKSFYGKSFVTKNPKYYGTGFLDIYHDGHIECKTLWDRFDYCRRRPMETARKDFFQTPLEFQSDWTMLDTSLASLRFCQTLS